MADKEMDYKKNVNGLGSDIGQINGNLWTDLPIDEGFKHTTICKRESKSPLSGLDIVEHGNHNSDSDSMSSGKYGIYKVNPASNDKLGEVAIQIGEHTCDRNTDNLNVVKSDGVIKDSVEKKLKLDRKLVDTHQLEKFGGDTTSWKLNEMFTGSRPDSVASSNTSGTPSKDKDPARKEKEKEREDRMRQTQQKLAEERQKKIEEMKEQQRLAQENREKQMESRRQKIVKLKKKEEERRKQVEERRKTQEDFDKAKKEAILSKAKERLTRYEQWKSHGRKGYHGESPPSKQLSMSLSVLYHKSSPQFSSSATLNTHSTGGLKSEAESMIALHSISENQLGHSIVASAAPSIKHKISVNLTGIKMRDPNKTSTRKPRPSSSVAMSMPSFVAVESDSLKSSSISKSTDRSPFEHIQGRVSIKADNEKADGKERKAATLPRPYDKKKIEERRHEVLKKAEERKGKEKEKDRMTKSEIVKESEDTDKPPARMSRSFVERMAIPRHPQTTKKELAFEPSSVKAKPAVKDKTESHKELPKAICKAAVEDMKEKDDFAQTKSITPKLFSHAPSGLPFKVMKPQDTKDAAQAAEESASEKPEITLAEEPVSKPAVDPEDLEAALVLKVEETEVPKTSPKVKLEARWSPEPKAAQKIETKVTSKTDKEHEMDEYKAKLAEKRRLAREKAEKEAEIERIKLEEEQHQEEERQRLEEERQQREEEQALCLAMEAHNMEVERLQKAIEAEENRKREEAERLEHERISREESERKTKDELERREREMAERARKEEEERTERRKRLEMIMKRVKTDTPASSPDKARMESPTRAATVTSGRGSQVSSEDEGEQEDKSVHKLDSSNEIKFKSPFLQKIIETKVQPEDSGTQKFKSPLLQSIMGKTKIGARLSGTRLDEMDKSMDNLTQFVSSENLSEKTKTQETDKDSDKKICEISVSNGLLELDKCDSKEVLLEFNTITTHSDVDFHDDTGVKTVIDVDMGKPCVNDTWTVTAAGVNVSDSQTTVDSAFSLSFNGVSSPQNEDVHIAATEFIDSKDLVDSSISLYTVDSFSSSQSGSIGGSFQSLQKIPPSDCTQFEEIIDLSSRVPAKSFRAQQPMPSQLMNHGVNLFTLDDVDDRHDMGNTDFHSNGRRIIAFEEHVARRQDVPDILS